MSITLPVGSLIYFNNTIKLSEHNRQPVSLNPERIEKTQRMANGSLRKFFIADKMNMQLSWTMLPSYSSQTVDLGYGAIDLKSFYEGSQDKAAGALSGTKNFDVTVRYGGPKTITGAVANGSSITYTFTGPTDSVSSTNKISVGDYVDIYNVSPSGFNLKNAKVTAATTNTFTVASTVTGTFSGSGGQAFRTKTYNMIFQSCSFEIVKRNVKSNSSDVPQEFWNVNLAMVEI